MSPKSQPESQATEIPTIKKHTLLPYTLLPYTLLPKPEVRA
jgi:hypothetical protein